MICTIKCDRGLRPAKVFWGGWTYDIDRLARKFKLMSGLMRDGPAVDQHDRLLPGEGHGDLSRWVTLGLLALGESPCGHVVLHHGAIFELVPDGVSMVWAGRLEKLLEVIDRLPHLAFEITLGGSDVFHVRVVIGLLVVVIVVTASSNYDPLGAPLWPPPNVIGAPLSAFASNLGWCPRAAFPLPWTKTAPIASSPEACQVPMSRSSFVVFG
jgi:hypothetical protein